MEDRNKPKAHKAAGDAESIVELTSDMELPEDSDVRIIDLTDAIDGPVDVAVTTPPAVTSPTEKLPETEATAPPTPTGQVTPNFIEQEVDAAFDAVQAPLQKTAQGQESIDHDEKLIDRLSDIPRMVDSALETADSGDTRMEKIAADKAEPMEPPELAVEDMAAAAAELDSAISGSDRDDEDEEIINLTEIVDPSLFQPADSQQDEGDDQIIELTDIVDPAELRVKAVIETQDDEKILELTDIVDPAELEAAPAYATAQAPEQSGDFADHGMTWKTEIIADQTADKPEIEAAPIDSGSLPENLAPEPAADPISTGAIAPFEDDPRHQESVIRLSDVLSHNFPRDERPPTEEIKMGVEEELAKQTISLEAEDTANAMGLDLDLDLEKETRQGGKPLTDPEIEAAIERIILTKYAETIEQLIAKAVEKAVTREIENIKRAMLDGDEPLT